MLQSNDIEIAVQLYSLRAVSDADLRLAMVCEAGLSAVEPWSAAFVDPAGDRRRLDAHGLAAPSAHVGLDRLRNDLEATCEAAHTLGCRLLVLWGLPDAQTRRGAAAWREAGLELGQIGEALNRRGLHFAYHNHDWELAACEDGRPSLDHMLEACDGASVGWQPDVAWLVRGGADPLALLDRHAHRVVAAHLKDVDVSNTDEEGWADLGAGEIDLPPLWARLVDADCRLMVLEHDQPSNPARFLAASTAHARLLAVTTSQS